MVRDMGAPPPPEPQYDEGIDLPNSMTKIPEDFPKPSVQDVGIPIPSEGPGQAGEATGGPKVDGDEPAAPKDPAKDSLSPHHVHITKKLSRSIEILGYSIVDVLEDNAIDMPPGIDHHIKSMQKLTNQLNLDQPPKAAEDSDEEEFACEILRLTMDDWRKPVWAKSRTSTPIVRAYYRIIPSAHEVNEHGKGPAVTGVRERPQRVVIDSMVLKSELEEIIEMGLKYLPTIMAAPFKLLSKYYPEIGARVDQLEEQLAEAERKKSTTSSSIDIPGTDVTQSKHDAEEPTEADLSEQAQPTEAAQVTGSSDKPPVKVEEEEEAKRQKELSTRVSYLKLLQNFIKTELSYYLELQAKVEAGSLETIAFEDLWYLFRPGDVIFAKENGFPRLYTVYATSGGQIRRRNHTNEENAAARMGLPPPRYMPRYPGREYSSEDESEDSMDMKHTPVNASGSGTWSPFMIDCYHMGYDGLLVGPVDSSEKIKYYSGEMKITDLPVYPLRYHKDRDQLVARLKARGLKLLNSYGHKSYNAQTVPKTPRGYQELLKGDIFIDMKHYYSQHQKAKPKLCELRKTKPDIMEIEESISGRADDLVIHIDHEVGDKITDTFMSSQQALMEPITAELAKKSSDYLMLLPYRAPAYVFKTRHFVHVDIEMVADIDKSDEARDTGFEDLVIPDSHRNLLVALVQNHDVGGDLEDNPALSAAAASTQIDLVRGKGRGLIILLHGPPGSGKTSTAETIAAYTRRPLYSITCGDLGTRADTVEYNLKKHTDRAHRWGCVLLLDEADVFLTRRDWRDMERNALVSVFLRQLEYYSGILFLTTNRVGVIDEAFKSRVHVSLQYPSIELKETLQIWENTLNRIARDNKTAPVQIKFDREALLSFASKHYQQHEDAETTWNGRQIRNAFQTAIALGYSDRDKAIREAGMTLEEAIETKQKKWMTVKLTTKNFRSIAKTAREFEDYLTNVRGQDSFLAKEEHLRNDAHRANIEMARKSYASSREPRQSSGYLTPPSGRSFHQASGSGHSATKKVAKPRKGDEDDDREDEDIFEENLSSEND